MLYCIAQKLGRSKTACAEEILDVTVRDVYKQIELPPLTAGDIQEYAAQTEKPLPEKAAANSAKKG